MEAETSEGGGPAPGGGGLSPDRLLTVLLGRESSPHAGLARRRQRPRQAWRPLGAWRQVVALSHRSGGHMRAGRWGARVVRRGLGWRGLLRGRHLARVMAGGRKRPRLRGWGGRTRWERALSRRGWAGHERRLAGRGRGCGEGGLGLGELLELRRCGGRSSLTGRSHHSLRWGEGLLRGGGPRGGEGLLGGGRWASVVLLRGSAGAGGERGRGGGRRCVGVRGGRSRGVGGTGGRLRAVRWCWTEKTEGKSQVSRVRLTQQQ